MDQYVEAGGTWRPFWLVAGVLGALLLADLILPGGDVPPLLWVVAIVAVLGIVGAGCHAARRVWTVRVGGQGEDAALSVGPERVLLSAIDVQHLRAVDSGVDAGAPVLGGGWSLPRGRTGLPLKLDDGRSVLVPTRDPARLYEALMLRFGGTPDGPPGSSGTLGR